MSSWLFASNNPEPPKDDSEALRRIEQNTASIVNWLKILVIVMLVFVAVVLFLF
jgi:hypothetical protein